METKNEKQIEQNNRFDEIVEGIVNEEIALEEKLFDEKYHSDLQPPTTRKEALKMVNALNPYEGNNATELDKKLAYERLQEFITALLPE